MARLLLALSIAGFFFFFFCCCALANVEKVIFITPPPPEIAIAQQLPTGISPPPASLLRLSPGAPRLRATLNTSFPAAAAAAQGEGEGGRGGGSATWVALEALTVGQRYEVRICWAATTPADFTLRLYSSSTSTSTPPPSSPDKSSYFGSPQWYLQILSNASYYTTDEKRMLHPDPVPVELVLDPYILNVLPSSLLHTAGAVVSAVFAAWWASIGIYKWLRLLSQTPPMGNRIVVNVTKKTD